MTCLALIEGELVTGVLSTDSGDPAGVLREQRLCSALLKGYRNRQIESWDIKKRSSRQDCELSCPSLT